MMQLSTDTKGYAVWEQVYEDGRLRHQHRVAVVPDFSAGAEKIAHLEKFRSVQDWRDVTYTLEPVVPAREKCDSINPIGNEP